MEEIIEQYGIGILQMLGGIVAFFICMKLFGRHGVLEQICLQYMREICG